MPHWLADALNPWPLGMTVLFFLLAVELPRHPVVFPTLPKPTEEASPSN